MMHRVSWTMRDLWGARGLDGFVLVPGTGGACEAFSQTPSGSPRHRPRSHQSDSASDALPRRACMFRGKNRMNKMQERNTSTRATVGTEYLIMRLIYRSVVGGLIHPTLAATTTTSRSVMVMTSPRRWRVRNRRAVE